MLQYNFFTILKSGLDTAAITDDDIVALKACTREEWQQLTDLAVKQSVAGVFFDGIQNIYKSHGEILPKTEWARELKGRLFGITLQLEQRNKKQIAVMNKVGGYMQKHGCQMMVMKGQACAAMYPNPLHRSIGDIDCYLYDDYAKGNELIRKTGVHVDDSHYKHSEFCIEGETFENHQYFVTTRAGERYKRLDRRLKGLAGQRTTDNSQETRDKGIETKENGLQTTDNGLQMRTSSDNSQETTVKGQNSLIANRLSLNVQFSPVMFNALFLTYHACIHFVSEGLRLKQVLDWVMFVKKHQEDVDWDVLHRWCEEYKLNRFLMVMNAIAVEKFGVVVDRQQTTDKGKASPDDRQQSRYKGLGMMSESPYVDKVMHSILYDDDYIFNSNKGKLSRRFHIVSNMFKYRWKYHDIFEESTIMLLCTKTLAFLFKKDK